MQLGTLLVTGGTGSFGHAFVSEALKHDVTSIRIYSRGEYEQWRMNREYHDPRLRFLIGDVRDKDRLSRAMNGADYVVHAAALKHVLICDYNPFEAVKTNILGAMNVIDCAIDNGVKKVLAISSDKAVHPINLYGATKLAEEYVFKHGNVYGKTKFACLRPGNYTESRGNVMEVWQEQAATTKVLTLTDERMKRYFIPVSEVAQIAVYCLERMQGGEVFVPKMQEQRMIDLANQIATATGSKLAVIGAATGERLSEPLFIEGELERVQEASTYYIVRPVSSPIPITPQVNLREYALGHMDFPVVHLS